MRKTCADLVHDVVVVGTGRAVPSLIVEAKGSGLTEEQKSALSQTIVERTKEFNEKLFRHEKIQDPRRVFIVEKGTLPRTKVCLAVGCLRSEVMTVACMWCLGKG